MAWRCMADLRHGDRLKSVEWLQCSCQAGPLSRMCSEVLRDIFRPSGRKAAYMVHFSRIYGASHLKTGDVRTLLSNRGEILSSDR